MSWLSDRKIMYRYVLGDEVFHLRLSADAEPPQTLNVDGKEATYAGFEPDELKQTSVVAYDQNGRLAYRVKDKNGKISHISRTKYVYAKTGRIENQYTPAYREYLEKTEQEQYLKSEENMKRARATKMKDEV